MFYINISNGLLHDGHRKRMGEAVWEFMWCIDKVTRIDDKGTGYVLGGKPMNLCELAVDMGVHDITVSRNLNKLKKQGYLNLKRTPYGVIITVHKAKKRFNKDVERFNRNAPRFSENVKCNKTYQDNNKDSSEEIRNKNLKSFNEIKKNAFRMPVSPR